MNQIIILIACAEGALIIFFGGLIAKSVFKMSDSISSLSEAIATLVKKEDCDKDMQGHCSRINELEQRMRKIESFKSKAEIWHREDC